MRAAVLVCALLSAGSAMAAPRPMPTAGAESYAVGQTFANCSAHWAFASEVASGLNLKETAIAFADTARGWKLAGMVILSSGVEGDIQTTFDNMVAIKTQQLRADYELQPDAPPDAMMKRFNQECGGWVDTQQAIIAAARRSGALSGGAP